MINATNTICGYKSIYQRQHPNNKSSTMRCTNTAHVYFHNDDSSKIELIQQPEPCKFNPGFYEASVNYEISTEKIAEVITDSIREFLKNNTKCQNVNVKFHSFDNDSSERMREVVGIVTKNFPGVEIKATSKAISHLTLTESRLRNRMARYAAELNKNPNLKYEMDFYISNGTGRSARTSDEFFKESENLNCKYRDEVSKNIKGMRYVTENTSLQYFYEGEDLSGALDKLVAQEPFVLDCRLFVNLCFTLSIRDELGRDIFNERVSSNLGGKFLLEVSDINKLLDPMGLKIGLKYQGDHNKGDVLFIRSLNASVFHPASASNSSNLICLGKNSAADNQLMFQGFGEGSPLTLAEWKVHMADMAKCNLSYADLQLLSLNCKSSKIPNDGDISYKKAWDEIQKVNGSELLINELDLLAYKDMRSLYDTSGISMPDGLIGEHIHVVGLMTL